MSDINLELEVDNWEVFVDKIKSEKGRYDFLKWHIMNNPDDRPTTARFNCIIESEISEELDNLFPSRIDIQGERFWDKSKDTRFGTYKSKYGKEDSPFNPNNIKSITFFVDGEPIEFTKSR